MKVFPAIIDNGHRCYESLLCYKKAVIIYDLTTYFCSRFIDKRDRTYDQMVQAARSGKQNIVEGYTDASTSYEVALKLYNVSRGSYKELLEDYNDYLRTRCLTPWEIGSNENRAMRNLGRRISDSDYYIRLAQTRNDQTIANMVIVLLHQQDRLLCNFIESEGRRFTSEGGFREKLTRLRLNARR